MTIDELIEKLILISQTNKNLNVVYSNHSSCYGPEYTNIRNIAVEEENMYDTTKGTWDIKKCVKIK